MLLIDYLSRLTHISMAILLLGGVLFKLSMLIPVLEDLSSPGVSAGSARWVTRRIHERWKYIVHLGITLFLLSGFYNYFRAIPNHRGDVFYHALLGTKMLLAFALFFFASVMVGKSPRFESWRQGNGWPLRLICVLGVIIVLISSFVRVRTAAVP